MPDDQFDIEILPDGRIKTSSPGQISPANHSGASEFLKLISSLTGGPIEKTKLKQTHTHQKQGAEQGQ